MSLPKKSSTSYSVRVGFVGLGMRGADAVVRYTYIPGAKVAAICDLRNEAVEASLKDLRALGVPDPACYGGSETAYKALCESDDVDLVYICTDWASHVPLTSHLKPQTSLHSPLSDSNTSPASHSADA